MNLRNESQGRSLFGRGAMSAYKLIKRYRLSNIDLHKQVIELTDRLHDAGLQVPQKAVWKVGDLTDALLRLCTEAEDGPSAAFDQALEDAWSVVDPDGVLRETERQRRADKKDAP